MNDIVRNERNTGINTIRDDVVDRAWKAYNYLLDICSAVPSWIILLYF